MNSKRETLLLKNALCFEQGHRRRTQHILKVHNMTRLLASCYPVSEADLEVLAAAAILHDIPIRLCKEKYGRADQDLQRREAPALTAAMLKEAGYPDEFHEQVLPLVLKHHCYQDIDSLRLQILMEADLLVNVMESPEEYKAPEKLREIFRTPAGLELFDIIVPETDEQSLS